MKKNLLKILTLGLIYTISTQLSCSDEYELDDSKLEYYGTDAESYAKYLKDKGVLNDSDTILKKTGYALSSAAKKMAMARSRQAQDPLLARLHMIESEIISPDEKWVGLTIRQLFNNGGNGIDLGASGNYLMQMGVFSNLAELNPVLITRRSSQTLSEKLKFSAYFSECMNMIRYGGASIEDVRSKMIADGMLIPLAETDPYAALEAEAIEDLGVDLEDTEFGGGEASDTDTV